MALSLSDNPFEDSPHRNDVLCGRGKTAHLGNAKYVALIEEHAPQYTVNAETDDEKSINNFLIWKIRSSLGRFIKKQGGGRWEEIEEGKVRGKICQALADKKNANKSQKKNLKVDAAVRVGSNASPNREEDSMAGTTGLPRRNSLASFGAAELDLSEASIMEWDSTFHPELPSGVTSPSDATTMEQTVSSNRNGSTVADLHLVRLLPPLFNAVPVLQWASSVQV